MGLKLDRTHIGLRVVHPNWGGRALYGTIANVPNQWHADVSSTSRPTVRAAQDSLVWAQDFEKAKR